MSQDFGTAMQSGVLTPTVPRDIGARTQRQRILDAMAVVVAEKTFSAATITDIVGQASISRATFYKHFTDKRECFDAAMESFVTELKDTAVQAQFNAESCPDAVRQAAAAILEQLAEKPAYANLALINAPILAPGIITYHREHAVNALKVQWGPNMGGDWVGADVHIAFGRAHVLIANHLVANRAEQLPELFPELSYTMLLPFVGHEEALAQIRAVR